ncbi:protein FAM32A [Teleopsis dalmanni]|uniref:protein FAM32A n=1 Tax=Teleopsis dalmanni TaxID=139649 RepID=UPI0018CDBE3A|nr:protein FAM32A [Teleopsis dalmanni]
MSDEYSVVSKSKLKLKNDSQLKKKKKKSKDKEKKVEALHNTAKEYLKETEKKSGNLEGAERKLTKAEKAFKQQQEKMRNKRIMERASTTHKERVEKFNEHLDTLTEHFDIPKVSWTK